MDRLDFIRTAIAGGQLPHAFLLEGEDALPAAELIAAAAVCTGVSKPCGVCEACKKARTGNHPDILRYEPGQNIKSYTVDLIRSIRQDVYILPGEANKKVYLLLQADDLREQAQNALLKTLEEPPEYAVFILTCRSKEKLLETVRSRCAVFVLGVQTAVFDPAVTASAGALLTAAATGSELALLKAANDLGTDKISIRQTLLCAGELLRQAYIYRLTGGQNPLPALDRCSIGTLLRWSDLTDGAAYAVLQNLHTGLNLTKLCADLRRAL